MKTYLRVVSYLWPYKWRVVQVLVLSGLTAVFSVGSIGALKPLFDTLFEKDGADFSVGLQAHTADGTVADQVRIRPRMPEGWRSKRGRNWRVFKQKATILEGFRTDGGVKVPIEIENPDDDPIEDISLDATVVSKGWRASVVTPDGTASRRLGPGEKMTVQLVLTPDHSNRMFAGAFWQTPRMRKVADWLQARVFPNKFKALFVISGLFLLATILKGLCLYNKTYWSSWLSRRSMADLRSELFNRLIAQSVNYFDNRKSGAIISKFTYSLGQIQKGSTAILSILTTEPLMVIGALALAFSINVKLTLIGILIFPLNLVVILVMGKLIRRATHRMLKLSSNMMQLLQRSIDGIRIVKAFLMEDSAREGFTEANDLAFRYDMRGARARSMLQPVIESFSATFVVLFLILGGVSVLRGEMTSGDFITFYAAMIACYAPIRKINTAYADIQVSIVGAHDIFAELDSAPDVQEAPDAIDIPMMSEALEFKSVSFAYTEHVPVLRDVNLRIEKGMFVALVGPSGAGKSTLVNMIPRLYDVQEGVITIDGTDIRKATFFSLRGQIGFVTQEPILFHDSIANNIAFGKRDATLAQIEEAARTAHAHEFIKELSGGYQAVIGDRGVKLSGGQRQRLALARAIMRNPEILILDEATSSLDTESERLIQDSMEKFSKGRTTIVIAHRLSTVLHARKIVVMNGGRIVETGTHHELLAHNGLYRRLYEIQFRDDDPAARDAVASRPKPLTA
ncbi:MAG: ABC transporter ATP-binding protein [Acidobacteriota bacterium]